LKKRWIVIGSLIANITLFASGRESNPKITEPSQKQRNFSSSDARRWNFYTYYLMEGPFPGAGISFRSFPVKLLSYAVSAEAFLFPVFPGGLKTSAFFLLKPYRGKPSFGEFHLGIGIGCGLFLLPSPFSDRSFHGVYLPLFIELQRDILLIDLGCDLVILNGILPVPFLKVGRVF